MTTESILAVTSCDIKNVLLYSFLERLSAEHPHHLRGGDDWPRYTRRFSLRSAFLASLGVTRFARRYSLRSVLLASLEPSILMRSNILTAAAVRIIDELAVSPSLLLPPSLLGGCSKRCVKTNLILLLSPLAKNYPPLQTRQNSSKSCPLSPGFLRYCPTVGYPGCYKNKPKFPPPRWRLGLNTVLYIPGTS